MIIFVRSSPCAEHNTYANLYVKGIKNIRFTQKHIKDKKRNVSQDSLESQF